MELFGCIALQPDVLQHETRGLMGGQASVCGGRRAGQSHIGTGLQAFALVAFPLLLAAQFLDWVWGVTSGVSGGGLRPDAWAAESTNEQAVQDTARK